MNNEIEPQTEHTAHSTKHHKKDDHRRQIVIYTGIAVILCCVSFVAGMQVEKSRDNSSVARNGMIGTFDSDDGFTTGGPNGMGGPGMRSGSFGTVTAVSDSSITIKDARQGTTATYTITSSTTVSDSGSTASVSDISVGDTVMIRPDSSDSKTANTIIIGGAPGTQQSSPSSSGNSIDVQTN